MGDAGTAEFDVFVSYRWVDPDRTWVRENLVPALVNAKLTVCLDVNDFVPGRDVFDEMTRAGTTSRRGLCVISPDYIEGNRYTTFESNLLQRLDPSGQESRLIPLILRETFIPERIRGLIRVDWTRPADRVREWKKLLAVLEAGDPNAPDPESLARYKGLSGKDIEILRILEPYHGFGVYKFPHIPAALLPTAKKVCCVPEGENVLCLIVLGPPGDYLLFGRGGVYFRVILKSLRAAAIPYAEFPSRTFTWGKSAFDRLSRKVKLGGGQFVVAIDVSPDTLAAMLNSIREAVVDGRLSERP